MKWIVGIVLSLSLAFAILFLLGRKTFHAEITIDATPEEVWSVLTDVSNYAAWNPLLVPISGGIREGAEVEYRMTQPDGTQSIMKSRVGKVVALKELHQHAGITGILTAHHSYRLEPTQGGTRLIQHEVDNGVAMLFWDSSWVQPTYEEVNQALKRHVEGLRESQQ
ncbi:MAG: SRPBCC domain-containing protein [Rhodospirillales bacterium]|nr:SRPBCC domain-containing protein [Rhodospirillales bacterium]MDE0372933.1 SRPBCC domain-containing protein [Rhodospirillales bacterium]MXX23050.1 SRPBCC domain-containing protein [Rhodospirillales bacterium]